MSGDLIICTRITRPSHGSPLVGPNNRQLVSAELRAFAAMYWPSSQVQNAIDIAECESGGWTGAWAFEGEDSRGLFQLNVEAHPDLLTYDLFDPQINAYFASGLWLREGWAPWSCAEQLQLK